MEAKGYYSGMGKFSTQVAIASFAFGTFVWALGLLFPSDDNILMLGLFYVMVAITFNTMVLLGLAYCCIKVWHERAYYATKMLIVLANIPIASFYLFLLFYFLCR